MFNFLLFPVLVFVGFWVAFRLLSARLGTSRQKILENWSVIIQDGADLSNTLFKQIRDLIFSRDIPGLSKQHIKVESLSDNTIFSDEARSFLIIRQTGPIQDYAIYIGVRPYGKECQLLWYLILEPSLMSRIISALLTKDQFAYAESLSMFAKQDLSAHVTVVHTVVKQIVRGAMEGLKQDFSKVDTKSKGVLGLW